jgi:trans-aconitate 2-methyltransferase
MTNMHKDWNPELYLKFEKERTQPSIDLVSHLTIWPETIIDIGCGPGNSTKILFQRWPYAKITGVDISPAMIEKAKSDFPQHNWWILDAGKDEITGKYDLVFSNATIQWIPNHAELVNKFYSILNEKGVLAVQLPLFWEMSLGKAIKRIAENIRWNSLMAGVTALFTIHDRSFYYDHLSSLFTSVEIWESSYMHILDSHMSILEMIRGTGLRPYLDSLKSTGDKNDFEEEILIEIQKDYPFQRDGKVIFPFKRLFFIAYK